MAVAVGSGRGRSTIESFLALFLNHEQIACTRSVRDLGVTMDGFLNFDDHVQNVYKSPMR